MLFGKRLEFGEGWWASWSGRYDSDWETYPAKRARTDAGDGGESDGDSGSMMAATVAPSAMGTAMEASQTGCDAVPAPAVLIAPAAAPPTAVPAGFAFAGTFLNARVATSRPCRV